MIDPSGLRLDWRKATASQANGNCVEVAPVHGAGVLVRDSKDPEGPSLHFTPAEWSAFIEGANSGEFDFDFSG